MIPPIGAGGKPLELGAVLTDTRNAEEAVLSHLAAQQAKRVIIKIGASTYFFAVSLTSSCIVPRRHGLKIGVAGHYCESNEGTYRVALSTLGQKCSSGALPRNC
jgi:hypothetical protein